MFSNEKDNEQTQGVASQAVGVASNDEQAELVFKTFQEACDWSRENAGRAFTRCANGVDFRPVPHDEAYIATQSWHEFEELYVDGPYRNEMS